MVTHIVLVNYTAKGIEHIKESPNRAATFVETARRSGVEVEGLFWTSGNYDGVLLLRAPDEEAAAAVTLSLGRGGYVHTKTLRAFDKTGIQAVLDKL